MVNNYDYIAEIVANHGTNYHEWKHLISILHNIVNNASQREEKKSLVGHIMHCIRWQHLEGHKRYNRKHHLDILIDMLKNDCKLTDSEIEGALIDYEDENQWQLAPKKYENFTGMIIMKILGLPEREDRYAAPKFMDSPSPDKLPQPYFNNKRVKS